ncbi:MFS transporter [Micromonospora sp. NPDC005206]|uniref:MFS transporter n=1 Tax=Micromonospora sp. NPDC005206 TaxID=3157022 RepID=UPI0033A8EC1A
MSSGSTLRRGHLGPNLTLFLLASILVSFLASSFAPTPLYSTYQAAWHFSPIVTTVVFGVYAVAVLGSLLTAGKLSDHVGRRPVLIVAIAIQMISLIIFILANGVPTLLAARIVQGLAVGLAIGAIGAAMLDVNRARGTLANSIAPGIGGGLGALLSALLVQFLPAPTRLIYIVLLVVLLIQAVGVVLMPETVTAKPGAVRSLLPEISLPRTVRGPMLVAAPVFVAGWSLLSFFGALGPALVRLLGPTSIAIGGVAIFVFTGVSSAAVFVLRNATARTSMLTGIATLILGMVITMVAIDANSIAVFFVGVVLAGIGFGGTFQGGLKTVMPLVEAHERASVLSLIYIICYVALGLPAVIAGFLVVHGGGLRRTANEFTIFVIVLAAIALIGLVGNARKRTIRAPG